MMTEEEIAALKADNEKASKAKDDEIAKLKADLEASKKPADDKNKPDDDLADKARKQREADDKKSADTKELSSAIKFNMGGKDWLKNNESLLPKNIAGIFEQADKENYGSEIEKASAVKVSVVQEFFAIQANLDLLTVAQKSALEDFQKLTKTVKQERVQQFYDMVFEPAFESLRRSEKAKQLSKGHGSPTDKDKAYAERLMKGSRTHYLGEKQNA